MRFLSGARFSNKSGKLGTSTKPGPSLVPKQIRASTTLLWIQGVLGLLLSAFDIVTTWQIQHLTDAQLAEQTRGQLAHDSIPYPQLYGWAAILVILSIMCIWAARGLKHQWRFVRVVTFASQALLIPVSFVNTALYFAPRGAFLFILPAFAIIVMLSIRPVRTWFATT